MYMRRALAIALAVVMTATAAFAQNAILPNGRTQFLSANGAPLVGGSVGFYVPATLTPKATYQDAAGMTPNANPVTLDALGSALVWGSGSYREIVKDALGNTVWDNVTTSGVTNGTQSALLDSAFGSTQGMILYRGASSWAALGPGTAGQVLSTNGSGQSPSWLTAGTTYFVGPCDGSTDLTAAFNADITALVAAPTGGRIVFAAGKCKFASAPATITYPTTRNWSLTLEGQGADVTVLLFSGGGQGLSVSMQKATQSIHVRNLTFSTPTAGASGQSALLLAQAEAELNFGQNDVTGVIFRGADGGEVTDYWNFGITVNSVANLNLINDLFYGDSTGTLGVGIAYRGAASPGDAIILNIQQSGFFALNTGVQFGDYWQGATINQTNFTNGTYGIVQLGGAMASLAQLTVTNSQFQMLNDAIQLNSAINNVVAMGNLFFTAQSHKSINAVDLNGGMFIGNECTYSGTVNTGQVCIRVGTVGASIPTTITGNVMIGQATGILLDAASTKVNVQSNGYQGNTADVTNNGVGNTIGGGSQ